MIEGFQVKAVTEWPGPPRARPRRSPFRAGWKSTLDLLRRELRHLGARDGTLLVDCEPRHVTVDGTRLKANARLRSSGIIITFESRTLGKQLSYPCDAFDEWQDNARAIALALEALRKVDRYKVTQAGQQYAGFARIPAQSSVGAVAVLAKASGLSEVNVRGNPALAFRAAAKLCHPDVGGDPDRWAEIGAAHDQLKRR